MLLVKRLDVIDIVDEVVPMLNENIEIFLEVVPIQVLELILTIGADQVYTSGEENTRPTFAFAIDDVKLVYR
jgi:hypothetical protein